ncbi:MAG: SafA/ExsA family spore coat assembly protein, partial [Firmicutes bacterium]|nr:SafA/ExsA family spore coat assembly protein [Bacillota bacterium]
MRKIHENNRTVKPGQPHVGPTQQSPPPPKTCTGFIYTVQSGDTMFRIAQRFGVSLDALIEANPQITDPNRIFPGQRICVPRVEAPGPPPPPQCSGFIYTVKQGDTLFLIAQRFGVTLNALIAANPQITDPNRIQVGQQICVPTGVPTPPPPFCPNGFIYTVQPGDTLFTIAQRFGVTLNALIAANPQITDPN